MIKLIKYYKPFTWLIIAIFILLFGQAMSELSLPGLMANIVNVGIQQNGVQDAAPDVIRASESDKLALFMNEGDKEVVRNNYVLLDKQRLSPEEYASEVEKYPLLASTPLYKLATDDRAEIAQLNTIFTQSISVVTLIEQKDSVILDGTGVQIPFGADPFMVLEQLPPDQLDAVRTAIQGKLRSMPDSLLEQYAITYIVAEYKTIGVGIDTIMINYMGRIGLFMLLLAFASIASAITVGYLSARVSAGLGLDLRKKLFGRVESFSNAEFDKFSTASLITRSTNDITQIQMLNVMLFRFVFFAPIMAIGGIIKVLNADRSMLWIIAAAIAILLLVVVVMFSVAMPRFRKMQQLVDKLNLIAREMLSGLMVIRAFNTQQYEEKRFDSANTDLMGVGLFINRVMVFIMPFMMLILNAVMILIIWIGSHHVDAGTMRVGDMMAFMQYAMQIIMSFFMISMVSIMLPRASVSADRIIEVIDTEPVINDPQLPETFPGEVAGVVEFRDVSFRYPGAEEDVLKHINFTATHGQTMAFIGSTGSGKSTLANLIMRFYDVSSGNVLVDGVDVRKVTQHDLRDKIGYIPQQAVLFSGTIESNIKYADEGASDETMMKSAEVAQAMDFVSTSEQRFASAVSQGGLNLSGGQRQRLSIARALAKKPEIYIFDDSFSALDFKTDTALRRALKRETNNATVLIITQRVGHIMGADRIVVLDSGLVAGVGTHKELMENCSVYREIALSQLSKEELAS